MRRLPTLFGWMFIGCMIHCAVGCKWAQLPSTHLFSKMDVLKSKPAETSSVPAMSQPSWSSGKAVVTASRDRARPVVSSHDVTFGDMDSPLQLVSHPPVTRALQITGLAEQRVSSWEEILRASSHLPAHQQVQVDYRDAANPSVVDMTTYVTLTEVRRMIGRQLQPNHVIRWQSEGVDHLTFCQSQVLTTVWIRRLAASGIYQAHLEMVNLGDRSVRVPHECTAVLGDSPMACLTVEEALAAIYSNESLPDLKHAPPEVDRTRFSAVSNLSQYLNWQSLEVPVATSGRRPVFVPPHLQYPGPAHRGDAIALTGSLLQADWLDPGAKRSGWIVFGHAKDGALESQSMKLLLQIAEEPVELAFHFDAD